MPDDNSQGHSTASEERARTTGRGEPEAARARGEADAGRPTHRLAALRKVGRSRRPVGCAWP